LRISTAVTCSLRSDATSGVVSSSSHATALYCRINYRGRGYFFAPPAGISPPAMSAPE
jgi:hypothetical protein